MAERSKALFFLRHVNDLDHITPIIWKLSELSEADIDVIFINDPALASDFRGQFLAGLSQVRVAHITEFAPLHKIGSFDHGQRTQLAEPNGAAVDKQWISNCFEWSFSGYRSSAVFFDVTEGPFQKLATWIARQFRIPSAAFPHGLSSFAPQNHLAHTDSIFESENLSKKESPPVFDFLVYPDTLSMTSYPGRGVTGTLALGSARCCSEWRKKLTTFAKPFSPFASLAKLKVALFPRSKYYPIFWEEVARTIKILTSYTDVQVVMQHHTRENDFFTDLQRDYQELRSVEDSRFKVVGFEEYSGSILEWADVVIDFATTLGIEGVLRKKPVFELEYTFAHHSKVAHLLPKTYLNCRDELHFWLAKLLKQGTADFYTPQEYSTFSNTILGEEEEKTLSRHVDFIESLFAGEIPTQSASFLMPSQHLQWIER